MSVQFLGLTHHDTTPDDLIVKSDIRITVPISSVDKENRITAGYASVEMLDKENEFITLEALDDAFTRFMKSEFNVMMPMHTNCPVAKVIPDWTDSNGQEWHAGVDKNGLFIVTKHRNDIKRADQVWKLIEEGTLKAYSIGGQAIIKVPVCDGIKCFWRIDKLDLHEISFVDNPANQGSLLTIVKRLDDIIKSDNFVKVAPLLGSIGHTVLRQGAVGIEDGILKVDEGVLGDATTKVMELLKEMHPEAEVVRDSLKSDPMAVYDLVLLRRNNALDKRAQITESLNKSEASCEAGQTMPPEDTKVAKEEEEEEVPKDKEEKVEKEAGAEASQILLEMKAMMDKFQQDLDEVKGELKARKELDEEEDEKPVPKPPIEQKSDVEQPQVDGGEEAPDSGLTGAGKPDTTHDNEGPKPVAKAVDLRKKPPVKKSPEPVSKGMTPEDIEKMIQKEVAKRVNRANPVRKRSPGAPRRRAVLDMSFENLYANDWDSIHKMAKKAGANNDLTRFGLGGI
jgi:HK97 family phage prohead protease